MYFDDVWFVSLHLTDAALFAGAGPMIGRSALKAIGSPFSRASESRSPFDGVAAPTPDVTLARLAEALVRTGRRDRNAFEEVYFLTAARLYGICLRVCGERKGAEDVLQDVYLTIWNRARTWEPGRSSPVTWLAVIAGDRATEWRSAQGIGPAIKQEARLELVDPADDAEAIASPRPEEQRIGRCLDGLDQRERRAIRSALSEGLTYQELAQRQGVPIGTMKSWVRRGLANMGDDSELDWLADTAPAGLTTSTSPINRQPALDSSWA